MRSTFFVSDNDVGDCGGGVYDAASGFTDNILTGNGGSDLLFGFGGDDTIGGGDEADRLNDGAGDDDLSGDGYNDNDSLVDTFGTNTLYGGIGNKHDLWCGPGGRAAVLSETVFVCHNARHQLCVKYGLLSRHNALVAASAKIRTGTHWILTVYIGVHKTNKK